MPLPIVVGVLSEVLAGAAIRASLASRGAAAIEFVQALLSLRGLRNGSVTGELDDATVKGVAKLSPEDLKRIAIAGVDLSSTPSGADMSYQQSTAPAELVSLARSIALSSGVSAPFLIRLIQLESKWNPNATNPSGAKGLMQLTKTAVLDISRVMKVPIPPSIMPAEVNIKYGCLYLKLMARYLGIPVSVLLNPTPDQMVDLYGAYNLGIGNYRKLRAGLLFDPALIEAFKTQAAVLRKGGLVSYRDNVRQHFVS